MKEREDFERHSNKKKTKTLYFLIHCDVQNVTVNKKT